MMCLLALDLSTKPGYAVFEGDKLVSYGTLFPEKSLKDFGNYPFNYVYFADYVAGRVIEMVNTLKPITVAIEETCRGKNSYSQKTLEFIHYAVVSGLMKQENPVACFYIRTGTWRGIVGANQNLDERKMNDKIRQIKRSTGKKLAKIDGKVVGLLTRKHSAIRAFKEHFGVELSIKFEDAAEAALMGLAFLKGASRCDGNLYGGVSGKTRIG
jgi:hypothetical protein